MYCISILNFLSEFYNTNNFLITDININIVGCVCVGGCAHSHVCIYTLYACFCGHVHTCACACTLIPAHTHIHKIICCTPTMSWSVSIFRCIWGSLFSSLKQLHLCLVVGGQLITCHLFCAAHLLYAANENHTVIASSSQKSVFTKNNKADLCTL